MSTKLVAIQDPNSTPKIKLCGASEASSSPDQTNDCSGPPDLASVLSALREFEACLNLEGRKYDTHTLTGGGGDWLVNWKKVAAALLRKPFSTSILPPVSGIRPKLRVLRSRLRNRMINTGIQAGMVNIRPSFQVTGLLRSFYFESAVGQSAKMVVGPAISSQTEFLDREIRNVKLIEQVGYLKAPKTLAYDLSCRNPFFIEQLIDGRLLYKRTDVRILSECLLKQMGMHWQEYGVTLRPASDCFGKEAWKRFEQVVDSVKWRMEWGDRNNFLLHISNLLKSDRQMIWSLCHADLNSSHVTITPRGEVVLIDWESARELPVAVDLVSLIHIGRSCCKGDVRPACENALRSLRHISISNTLFSERDQLLLAVLRPIFRFDELADRDHHLGKPMSYQYRRVESALLNAMRIGRSDDIG